jgi:hypothetical protein
MNIGCSVTEPMGAKSRGINRNRNSRPGTASAQRWTPAAAGLPRIGGGTARVESPGRVDPSPQGSFYSAAHQSHSGAACTQNFSVSVTAAM